LASGLCDWVSLCGIFIESLLAESPLLASLLVLCAASLLVVVVEVVELCASAGFAGVTACDISCGVFGVEASGVVLLSGVVVLVVEFEFVVVVLLAPGASVAGFAQG
jgi:hypothetical protein